MPHAESTSARVWYELDGAEQAPPLVLVRGFARSSRYWLDLRHELARSFRLVVLDNRGVGRSDAPPPPYSTPAMADDVAAVLDHAGVERAHVFGISMGGMIAQWVAIRHPRRVARLVLAATAPHRGGIPLDATLALLGGARMPFHEAIRHTAPWVLAPDFIARRPDVLDRWAELAESEPVGRRGLVGQALAVARHDARRHLCHIEAETLVITGDADRLIPARASYHLVERVPRARLRVVEGGGHDFPTEQPELTARVVTDFLRG